MLISVIVPIYKVEQYLERCVDSILNQTFTDFELVLVDDGSPDNCGAICDEYAKKDERIVVIHKENGGLSDARNAGIEWALKNSDSEWITFIDSDDWVHIDYLEYLYNSAKKNNTDISVCHFERMSDIDDKINTKLPLSANVYTPEDFYVKENVNAVVAWGKLYKKELWTDIRYPYGKIHEDEFTTYKLLFKCNMITVLDCELYYYYINPNGIMNSEWSVKRLDVLDALENQIEFLQKNHYSKALCDKLKLYIELLYKSNIIIKEKSFSNTLTAETNSIKKKMRKTIIKYHKQLRISLKSHYWHYEVAFPYLMRVYWLCKAIKSKYSKE